VFKCRARYSGLSDYALQSAPPQFVVQWNWHGRRGVGGVLLHHGMAAALTNSLKSVILQDTAHLVAR